MLAPESLIIIVYNFIICVYKIGLLSWDLKMAKNTSSSAFRRVDVDQFIEGKYEEDALTDDGVNGPNDMEIQTMLTQYPSWGACFGSTVTDYPLLLSCLWSVRDRENSSKLTDAYSSYTKCLIWVNNDDVYSPMKAENTQLKKHLETVIVVWTSNDCYSDICVFSLTVYYQRKKCGSFTESSAQCTISI